MSQQLITEIHKLIYNAWTREKYQRTGIICPIFKKRDLTKVKNYRRFSLLDTSYKILSLTILNKLEKHANRFYIGFDRFTRKFIHHVVQRPTFTDGESAAKQKITCSGTEIIETIKTDRDTGILTREQLWPLPI